MKNIIASVDNPVFPSLAGGKTVQQDDRFAASASGINDFATGNSDGFDRKSRLFAQARDKFMISTSGATKYKTGAAATVTKAIPRALFSLKKFILYSPESCGQGRYRLYAEFFSGSYDLFKTNHEETKYAPLLSRRQARHKSRAVRAG